MKHLVNRSSRYILLACLLWQHADLLYREAGSLLQVQAQATNHVKQSQPSGEQDMPVIDLPTSIDVQESNEEETSAIAQSQPSSDGDHPSPFDDHQEVHSPLDQPETHTSNLEPPTAEESEETHPHDKNDLPLESETEEISQIPELPHSPAPSTVKAKGSWWPFSWFNAQNPPSPITPAPEEVIATTPVMAEPRSSFPLQSYRRRSYSTSHLPESDTRKFLKRVHAELELVELEQRRAADAVRKRLSHRHLYESGHKPVHDAEPSRSAQGEPSSPSDSKRRPPHLALDKHNPSLKPIIHHHSSPLIDDASTPGSSYPMLGHGEEPGHHTPAMDFFLHHHSSRHHPEEHSHGLSAYDRMIHHDNVELDAKTKWNYKMALQARWRSFIAMSFFFIIGTLAKYMLAYQIITGRATSDIASSIRVDIGIVLAGIGAAVSPYMDGIKTAAEAAAKEAEKQWKRDHDYIDSMANSRAVSPVGTPGRTTPTRALSTTSLPAMNDNAADAEAVHNITPVDAEHINDRPQHSSSVATQAERFAAASSLRRRSTKRPNLIRSLSRNGFKSIEKLRVDSKIMQDKLLVESLNAYQKDVKISFLSSL